MPDIREDQHPKMWAVLFSKDTDKRLSGIDILSKVDLEWPIAWLALLLADNNQTVANAAYQALKMKGTAVLPLLTIQRMAPQPKIRQAVVRLMGELSGLESVEEAIPALFDPFVDVREEARKSIEAMLFRTLERARRDSSLKSLVEDATHLFAKLCSVPQISVRSVMISSFMTLAVENPETFWFIFSGMEPQVRQSIEREIVTRPNLQRTSLLYHGLIQEDQETCNRAAGMIERLLNKDNVSQHVESLVKYPPALRLRAAQVLESKGLMRTFLEYFPWIRRNLRIPFLELFREDFGEQYHDMLLAILQDINPHITPTLIDNFMTFQRVIPETMLRTMLSNPSPEVRKATLQYLYFRGHQTMVPHIMPLVSDRDQSVASAAVRTVSRICRDYLIDNFDALNEETRRRLTMLLQKVDNDFVNNITDILVTLSDQDRVRLVRILNELADSPSARDVLIDLLKDENEAIRATAVRSISRMPIEELNEDEINQIMQDPDPRVRANLIESLPLDEKRKRLDWIRQASQSEVPRERANSIVALFQLGEKEYEQNLIQMLRHPDSWMRTSALWVLSVINAPHLMPRTLDLLKDDQPHVRLHALRAISRKGTPELARTLTPFLNDPVPDVREAADEAIRKHMGLKYIS